MMSGKWHRFAALAELFVPMVISTVNPRLAPLGSVIGHAIGQAEAIPGASNSEKLAHVQAIAHDTAAALNASGKTHVDMVGLDEAVSSAVTTSIQVVKLVHPPVDVTVSNQG
jgi:hypothetical protein